MPSLREEQIVEEFQRRRKRTLHYFGFCFILIALSLAITQISDSSPSLLGLTKQTWKGLGIAQFIAGVVFGIRGFFHYRCPNCNEIVKGHDKYYLGLVVDPRECPNCGARLH